VICAAGAMGAGAVDEVVWAVIVWVVVSVLKSGLVWSFCLF
jgi:hypothetical protein